MGFFGKKDKLAKEEEAARNSLFGNRGSSPANTSQNPYSTPPPPYQTPSAGGYGQSANTPPPMGRNQSSSTIDRERDALFAGRQPQQQQSSYGNPPPPANTYGQPSNSYGGSQEQDEEDEDVEAIKQQIRFTKQESVSSTRNALRVAAQAEETGRNTLARLGTQGERLFNTEKNLDLAASQSRVAEQQARELKTLNRGMFVPHVKNPMMSKSRTQAEEAKILQRHQDDRDERERTRMGGYQGREGVGRALNSKGPQQGRTQMSLAERSKYQFEADESDDEKEREIEGNLDQLSAITGRLHGLAFATGQEVDRQNKQIDTIMKKSDTVDDGIAMTHNRLKRIR